MTAETSTMLDAALEHAALRRPVFPVWHAEGARCGCRAFDCNNEGKHPIKACAPNGFKNATTDETIIRRWWRDFPDANIAGPTGIWSTVLDVDPRKGGRESLAKLEAELGPLPTTLKALTGGDGEHYHFAPVAGLRNSAGVIAPGLDIRGEGGYVLLPPSNHVSGGHYHWVGDQATLLPTPFATMPPWLATLAAKPQRKSGPAPLERRSADEWADKLAGAPEGQRREVALEIAGHYLGLRIAPAEVETILLGYARRCVPPFPEREARELVRDLARRDATKDAGRAIARPVRSPDPDASLDGPVLVKLGDVVPEEVDWLWPGRVARGKITLIIGEPGAGKTYVTLDATARATVGAAWPDGAPGSTGTVLLLASEDGLADTVRPIVDRQGGDSRRVFVLQAVRVGGHACPFNLERDSTALEEAIVSTGAGLVIISPLSAYLGARDSYKDSEIRGILDPLAALAEEHRAAIVAILHLTKVQQRKLLLRAQGSVAFVAIARTVLAVGEDPETPGRRLLAALKNNLGTTPPALAFRITDRGLAWEPAPVEGSADQLLAGDEVARRSEQRERDEAKMFLRGLLADGPVRSKQIFADAKANGIHQRTLERAKRDLGVKAERTQTADGNTGPWYWHLPGP